MTGAGKPSQAAASGFWRSLSRPLAAEPLPKGLDAWWRRAAGWVARMRCRPSRLLAGARRVLALEPVYSPMADAALRKAASGCAAALARGRETETDLDHAAAIIREGAMRTLGFRHHGAQVAGGLGLWRGCAVEMATGEGKTLTAALPAILAGWRGRGCHVVTVNDYLASRDAEEMGRLYGFFGLSAGSIVQETDPRGRKAAYAADITYLANKEAAADFLRDRLALGAARRLAPRLLRETLQEAAAGHAPEGGRLGEPCQRGLEFAIIDEADSVLIDEAVTPLIISGDARNAEEAEAFRQARDVAAMLTEGEDYEADAKHKEIRWTPEGGRRLADLTGRLGLGGVWHGKRRAEELAGQALDARHFFRRGVEYIIDDGKVVIVDEATGRLMPDRTWRDGLHQAVETKEGVDITPAKATFARVSFQRFFRLYRRLSGMTGTAREAGGEFWQIYGLPVVAIPTNRPCLRQTPPPRVFARQEDKWEAVAAAVRKAHTSGRPVLVGTRSVEASEALAARLRAGGLELHVLNAVHHREEARIVARAGEAGRITIATNMAGRGTDIKLSPEAEALGGLHVIAAERHLSRRIDRQLEGRSARQGDPGSAEAILALDDELPRRFAPWLAAMAAWRAARRPEGIAARWVSRLFDHAERKAGRLALARRKAVLEADTWLRDTLGFAGEEW